LNVFLILMDDASFWMSKMSNPASDQGCGVLNYTLFSRACITK
jgi:hypothetical protein